MKVQSLISVADWGTLTSQLTIHLHKYNFLLTDLPRFGISRHGCWMGWGSKLISDICDLIRGDMGG